ASVAVVTDPAEYPAVLAELRAAGSLGEATRRRLAAAAFRHTAAYEARIAAELPRRLGIEAAEPFAQHVSLELERIGLLRYGENPHQRAAVYRLRDAGQAAGPFARGVDLRQGKALSYTNLLDAAAAAAIGRDLRGPACAIVKHTNPCGAAEAADLLTAWERALSGDPVSTYGGVVAVSGSIDAPLAERLTALFLEVVVAPSLEPEATAILARRPNLRVVVDASLGSAPADPLIEYRSAGGALLACESDVRPDDPTSWRLVTSRAPDARERADLDLAWRLARHVKSNAIVLVRDGTLVGVGAGQMSRVDSARLAVEKAAAERVSGAACASDAFFPFPDGLLACADAGVTAFVQPGGSVRDPEVLAAAEAAGVAMLFTGVRHFRH
ncbi:MAG: bifunctional phosphoribosylaminoimidazolecarboxamide formyltransferase/IMP cyclohydrolase, partial [Candidatus Limnocylindrales bacterium]